MLLPFRALAPYTFPRMFPIRLLSLGLAAALILLLPACVSDQVRANLPFMPPSKYVDVGGRKLSRSEVAYYEKIKALAFQTKVNPKDAVAYSTLGELRQQKGDYDLARKLYQDAIDRDPTLSSPHYNLGVIYLYDDRFNGALDELAQARKLSPDDAKIRHRLGAAKAGLAKYDEALKEFDEAIALDPEYTPAYLDKGKLLYSLRRYAEAATACRLGLAHAPKVEVSAIAKQTRGNGILDKVLPTGEDEEPVRTWRQEAAYDLALCLKAQGQFRDALTVLIQAEDAESGRADVQLLKARLLEATGDNAGALTVLTALRELQPNLAEVPKRMAKIYQKTGQNDLASKTRLEAAELDHSDKELQEEAARNAEQNKDTSRLIAIYERLTRVEPDNVRYLRQLAKAYDNAGIKRSAALTYQMIVNHVPDDIATRRRLGILYSELPGFDGSAMIQFKVVLEHNPQDSEIHRRIAGIYLKTPATYKKAEEHILKTLAANPKDAQAYNDLASLEGLSQRFESAVNNYKKALELDPKFFKAQLNMAKVLLQLKRSEEAIPALRAYLTAQPLDEEARRVLAEALRDLGRREEAVKEYEAIEELHPNEVGSKMELAALDIGLGKQHNAIGLYEQILEKHPSDLNALREAGRTYGEQKMTLRAVFCWQRLLGLKPGDVEAQSRLAGLYREMGDETAALQKYEAVGNAGDADAWKMVAYLRSKRNERDPAMQALREAIKIKSQDIEPRRMLVSMLLSDPLTPSGDEKDEALKLCKEMEDLDPKDCHARLNSANLLTDQNRLAEAQDEYEAILKLEPENGPANLGLGVVLRKRGRYQEALDLYKKTLAANPKSVTAYYNMGLIYDFYLKNPEKAKEHYAKYLELGGDPKKIPSASAPAPATPPATPAFTQPAKETPKETTSR